MPEPLAHLGPEGEAHLLVDHLQAVAALAAEFAKPFEAASWARFAGLWHDLGKYREGFQKYIRQSQDSDAHVEGRIGGRDKTHSAAGAMWADEHLANLAGPKGLVLARVLSYVIAGHHAGLDNWFDGLEVRFASADTRREFQDAMAAVIPGEVLRPGWSAPDLATLPVDGRNGCGPGEFALWVRMLFSCLVDADFLDTERFLDRGRSDCRGNYPALPELLSAFDAYMVTKMDAIRDKKLDRSTVNRARAMVLACCLEKAELPPGVFSLTVPTGGGKTLSSLGFALHHAVKHGKRRVIYAIPYTSIIEQTAEIFGSVFGKEAVVEHHSNFESEESAETMRSRLACENWDAPLIVTTNVQLFESLFARKTSRCRKLHNLIDSVVVLDEAQLLPVEFLQPILDVLRILVTSYGVTLLICTATQPALTRRESFQRVFRGFEEGAVTEIMDDVPALYAALKRVEVLRPDDLDLPVEWPDIANRILAQPAALAIVNRRRDAADLYRLVRSRAQGGTYHLSGLMCGQHRSDTIRRIRQALVERTERLGSGADAEPVMVVSTQLVEAGVDLDFPVVFRALAGLDAVAQAAGRCNREGRSASGEVHVFVPPTRPPVGLLRQAEGETRVLWKSIPAGRDPIDVTLFPQYFRRLYAQDLDAKAICDALSPGPQADVRFKDAAEAFKLIDEQDAAQVIVRYRSPFDDIDVGALIRILEANGPERWLLRKFQRYTVTVYRQDAERLLNSGEIRCVDRCPGLYVQANDILYDPELGLVLDGAPGDPAAFFV